MTYGSLFCVIAWLGLAAAGSERGVAAPDFQLSTSRASASPTIVLVGDSTVTDEKGWGLGFRRFSSGAEIVNAAASGRSSKSYLDEGRWASALAVRGTYYLIQFGHNDEPGKGPERETDPDTTYTANLRRYVTEARAAGGIPVLVTSLTRRAFGADGHVVPNLEPYVAAAKRLAANEGVPLLDLHADSLADAERLGDEAWASLSPREADGKVDRTHLNARGSLEVARLVVSELRHAVPALAPALSDDPAPLAVVAAGGTGDYTTVQAAIDAVPQSTSAARRWTIFVQAGRYRERVYVQREKRFVSLVGDDPSRVTITYDLDATQPGPDGQPIGTFRTPTVQIDADDLSAENITFENAAGPVGQALAVRVDGDRVVFRNCRFMGWQDTLFLNRGRQFVGDSLITGHVDYIFGGATAFFDRVHIHSWRDGYITAASTPSETPFGFVFANARITGASDVRTYLGRPWRDFAQVTFINTDMTDVVRREGWHNWDRAERERTARYREFGNRGAGATPAARVPWVGTLSATEAAALNAATVLKGSDGWDPAQVPAHPSMVRVTDLTVAGPPGPAASRER